MAVANFCSLLVCSFLVLFVMAVIWIKLPSQLQLPGTTNVILTRFPNFPISCLSYQLIFSLQALTSRTHFLWLSAALTS